MGDGAPKLLEAALTAANHLLEVYKQDLKCWKCPKFEAWVDGDDGPYGRGCNSEHCSRAAINIDPLRPYWDWFLELRRWKETGALGAFDEVVSAMDLVELRTFIAFNRALDEGYDAIHRERYIG